VGRGLDRCGDQWLSVGLALAGRNQIEEERENNGSSPMDHAATRHGVGGTVRADRGGQSVLDNGGQNEALSRWLPIKEPTAD
jgi:hypothetical protein